MWWNMFFMWHCENNIGSGKKHSAENRKLLRKVLMTWTLCSRMKNENFSQISFCERVEVRNLTMRVNREILRINSISFVSCEHRGAVKLCSWFTNLWNFSSSLKNIWKPYSEVWFGWFYFTINLVITFEFYSMNSHLFKKVLDEFSPQLSWNLLYLFDFAFILNK